jgi:hypothetical protein
VLLLDRPARASRATPGPRRSMPGGVPPGEDIGSHRRADPRADRPARRHGRRRCSSSTPATTRSRSPSTCRLPVAVLVRIRCDRVFYTDAGGPGPGSWAGRAGTAPGSAAPTRPAGRPRSRPSRPTTISTAGCRWRLGGLHPEAGRPRPLDRLPRAADRDRHGDPGAGRAPARAPRAGGQDAVAVVGRPRHARTWSSAGGLHPALRPRAHLPLLQAGPGLDHPAGAHPGAGRPLDLAGPGRLHPAAAGPPDHRRHRLPWERRLPDRPADPDPHPPRFPRLLPVLGTPASPPKPCGRSPGRPRGSRRGPAPRHPAIHKAAA